MDEKKKLLLWVPQVLHAQVKVNAALRNMSINKYVMQAVLERMVRDEQYVRNDDE